MAMLAMLGALKQIGDELRQRGAWRSMEQTFYGFGEAEAVELAGWSCDIIDARGDAAAIEQVKAKVRSVCKRLPVYGN